MPHGLFSILLDYTTSRLRARVEEVVNSKFISASTYERVYCSRLPIALHGSISEQ